MSSQFPFHGIFSGLGQDDLTPDDQPAKKTDDAPKGTGQVAVDIYELDNYYIIRAPIAGVKLSDLDIEVADNQLTIRGNRQQGEQIPNDQFYIQECFWGPFSRTVTLPFVIDPKKIRATFNRECILKILVPKEERVKIVRINEG
jgi:HSP20 family protein